MGEAVGVSTSEREFRKAFQQYRRAKESARRAPKGQRFDRAIARIDWAFEQMLSIEGGSPAMLVGKIQLLESEYGLNAQPRHLALIYGEAAILAALLADQIAKLMPG